MIRRSPIHDTRGFFDRVFCAEELAKAEWVSPVSQANFTLTRTRGTVRGLHYQRAPHAEMKLVNCLRGEIWDLILDLRPKSPMFMKWHAERLSAVEFNALLIPKGCAHGFQTLTSDVELLYLHSVPYVAEAEGGLSPLDPRLAIPWPLQITDISARDKSHPNLTDAFEGIDA